MANLIDVGPSQGLKPVDPSRVDSALLNATLAAGRPAGHAPGRFDASGGVLWRGALEAYHRKVDAEVIAKLGEMGHAPRWDALPAEFRADALGAGAGGFPRDFEFIRNKIWEEKRQPLNAMRLFPTSSEVPLGARSHTARRAVGSGEAQIHRGGSELPRASTAFVEEQFGVAYVVCAVETNFFETLTTDWAGLQKYQRDMRLAVRLVEERLNRICFSGDSPSNIHGVLDYPHLAKQVMSVDFDGSATGEAVAAALNDLVNTPIIQSGGTFMPNRLAVSPRIHRYLHQTKHSTTGGTDTTIAEWFLRGQDAQGVRSIDMAQELEGIGPAGATQDGILAYRDDTESMEHVLIQAPTALPIYQSSPLDTLTVIFAATGGMVMGDTGNHILGYATAA